MLDNLILYVGSESTNFPIMQFCLAYPGLLAEKNLHHITLSDMFPECINLASMYTFHDSWLYEDSFYAKNNLTIQSFEEIFPTLKEQIQKKNIKNLIILLNINTLFLYINTLIKCCKLLNAKNISLFYSKINQIRNVNAAYNLLLLNLHYVFFIPSLYNDYCLKQNKIAENEKLLQFFAKNLNIQIHEHAYRNEEECFYDFINQYQITVPKQSSFLPQATFAPQVIAFLLALYGNTTLKNHAALAQEFDFLYYFSKKNTFFSYHTKEFEQQYTAQNSSIPQDTIIDCSDTGLTVELDSALILAQKLSSKTRQQLLKNITLSQIKEMSVNSKTVYLALMHAENKISAEEINTLLSYPGNVTITEECQRPILTVYTTSYNSSKYIKNCIESIAAQKTKYPFIHLISDDNSTDGTQDILREYAKKYPHIRLILRKHNNILANYAGTLNSLSTKYVAVCDADDFYTDEKKLEKQIDFLEENPDCNLCFHPSYMYYEEENLIKSIYPTYLKDFTPKKNYYLSNIISTNLMQSSSVMYRWKWTHGITSATPLGLTPLDWALNIVHAYNSKIGFINEPMSLYRRHKEAFYALTVTNVPLHLITYCYSELQFIETLNQYTGRKYEKLFLEKVFRVLYNFYITAQEMNYDKEKYNAIKNKIELYFPAYIAFFKNSIATIQNNTK